MAAFSEQRAASLWRALRSRAALLVALLIVVWALLPLVPESTGLRFGWVYQVFFSAMVALGVLFFWFLGKETIRLPRRPAAVLGSLAAVFLVTVGLLVVAGVVYPQFSPPRAPKAAASDAAARGRDLFLSPSVGCFRCHKIAGKGGIRGPDLTHAATKGGERVPGLSARQYLLAKVAAGATYEFRVPKYAPMMPPYRAIVSKSQLEDLVAYLETLR